MRVILRSRKIKNNRKTLYLEYYQQGIRRYEFLRLYLTGDKNDKEIMRIAESIRVKRLNEAVNGVYGLKKDTQTKLIDYFEKVRATKRQALGVWKTALKHLKSYINDTNDENIKITQITPSWLEGFKTYLTNNVSKNTARNLYSCLSNTLKQAFRDGITERNVCDLVSNIKTQRTKKEYLELHELEKLSKVGCIDNNVKRAFLFSCFTGLRLGDIKRLKWSDVRNNQIELIQEKTSEPITIPLHETAFKLLGERSSNESNVFTLPSNTYMSYILTKWTKKAGLNKHVTYHTSRHTFATLSLTSGVDIYSVSKLLGHSRLETTQVYVSVIDEKKRRSIELLPRIEFNLN